MTCTMEMSCYHFSCTLPVACCAGSEGSVSCMELHSGCERSELCYHTCMITRSTSLTDSTKHYHCSTQTASDCVEAIPSNGPSTFTVAIVVTCGGQDGHGGIMEPRNTLFHRSYLIRRTVKMVCTRLAFATVMIRYTGQCMVTREELQVSHQFCVGPLFCGANDKGWR